MPRHSYPGFLRYNDFINLPCDPETWLIRPIIPAGGRVNLYGQPKKARKSYLALGAAWAISTGQDDWLGFEVKQAGPVLYLQADTPHTLWRKRAMDIHSGGYDMSNIWFASTLSVPYPFNMSEHEDILADLIAAVPNSPIMTIFDTTAALHTAEENNVRDMTLFMHALDRVAPKQAKLLVTHDRKGNTPPPGEKQTQAEDHEKEGGDLMRGNRGSTAIAGAMDTVIKMTPKGYMYYQGRAVGEKHKKLSFNHVHSNSACPCPYSDTEDCMGWMWGEYDDTVIEEAQKLLQLYKSGSERSLGRLLAQSQGWTGSDGEERARSIIRRQKRNS